MRKKYYAVLLLILSLILLTGCDTGGVPRDLEDQYHLFLETAKVDIAGATKYCYYTDASAKKNLLQMEGGDGGEATILEWKQLNASLWVVLTRIDYSGPSIPKPYSREYYQFVGYIDGKPYVMQNYRHVPDELRGDLDLTVYRSPYEA